MPQPQLARSEPELPPTAALRDAADAGDTLLPFETLMQFRVSLERDHPGTQNT
jgi:hypothetical protein